MVRLVLIFRFLLVLIVAELSNLGVPPDAFEPVIHHRNSIFLQTTGQESAGLEFDHVDPKGAVHSAGALTSPPGTGTDPVILLLLGSGLIGLAGIERQRGSRRGS